MSIIPQSTKIVKPHPRNNRGRILNVMKLLLGRGAYVNVTSGNENSRSAWHRRPSRCYKIVIGMGSHYERGKTRENGQNGQTVLHGAAAGEYFDAMGLPLDRGNSSQTALTPVAASGHFNAMKLLLYGRVDANLTPGCEGSQQL